MPPNSPLTAGRIVGLALFANDEINDAELFALHRVQVCHQLGLSRECWQGLLAEGEAYIRMALEPEVQRIVLLDGPAVLGDPSQWPSQSSCLQATRQKLEQLMAQGVLKTVDAEAAARLLSGAALNAALWIAASATPAEVTAKAVAAFRMLASGLLKAPAGH